MTNFIYYVYLIFLFFINLLNKFNFVNSYNLPIKPWYAKNHDVKIIEPVKIKEDSTLYQPVKDIIFLSGGANVMPNELYSNFLNNMASSNFRIYLTDFTNIEDYEEVIKLIESNDITIVLHSSSTKLALDLSNKYEKIKKIVMMDPVDNRFTAKDIFCNIMNIPNRLNVDIDDVLIINAKKSYTGSWNPPTIPFIPILSFNKNNLILENNKTVETITFDDNGHTDLLDKPWGDIMHKSRITVGTENRNYTDINNYHQQIVEIIVKFCS